MLRPLSASRSCFPIYGPRNSRYHRGRLGRSGLIRAEREAGVADIVLDQDAGLEIRIAVRVPEARAHGWSVLATRKRIRIDIILKVNLP